MAYFNKAIKFMINSNSNFFRNDISNEKFGLKNCFLNTINLNNFSSLRQEDAEDIYFQYFWLHNNLNYLHSQELANYIFILSSSVLNIKAKKIFSDIFDNIFNYKLSNMPYFNKTDINKINTYCIYSVNKEEMIINNISNYLLNHFPYIHFDKSNIVKNNIKLGDENVSEAY